GGTEVGACFLSACLAEPIKACSLGGPALGMAMDVVDVGGRPVRGEVGELVCRKPFPGMTRGFWRDPERYLETYWRRLLVPARSLGRHAQHRRQASGAGGAGVGRRRASGRRRGCGGRGAPRSQGR